MGHHSGAPERHRVDDGQVRREGEDLPGRGDRLLDVPAAQAGAARWEALATEAGMSELRRATETPFNLVLEIRP